MATSDQALNVATRVPSARPKRAFDSSHQKSGFNNDTTTSAVKRPRTSQSTLAHKLPPSLSTPSVTSLAKAAVPNSLRLEIPQQQLTQQDAVTLKRRKASAERWKSKLQRPYPTRREIAEAYPLKLLRHYTGPLNTRLPDLIKPRIDTSPRVEALLKDFPDPAPHELPQPSSFTPLAFEHKKHLDAHPRLWANRMVTRMEQAQRLAWLCFATRGRGRIDRGREAMIESGLQDEDFEREGLGLQNELPDWCKETTGRFVGSVE